MVAGGAQRAEVEDATDFGASAVDVTEAAEGSAVVIARSQAGQAGKACGTALAEFGKEGEEGDGSHEADAGSLLQARGFGGEPGLALEMFFDEGLDLFEPALALARRNLATTPNRNRVEFRLQDAAELAEKGNYDAIWLAMPFLPRSAVPRVVAAAARALRPGGWLLPGMFGSGDEPLGQLLCDLRTLRSGGHPWTPEELVTELTAHGLSGAREVPRSWPAPVRLFAARAPS